MLGAPTRQRGVTLIELAIGLLLIGILTVLAVPTYQSWMQNLHIRNASEGIMNGMQLARAEAVRRNALVQLVIGPGSSWVVSTVAAAVQIQQRTAQEGSENAQVTILPAGADSITFNGMGWLSANADGSASITRIDIGSVISAGTDIRPLRVIVTSGGATKMCDPAVAAGDPRACP